MKNPRLIIIMLAALTVAGCAADHNDTVFPGYYDGYHIPAYDAASLNDLTTKPDATILNRDLDSATSATNVVTVHTNDDDDN